MSSDIELKLIVSAQTVRALALEHYPHNSRGDCSWHHGVWQYFRALRRPQEEAPSISTKYSDPLQRTAVSAMWCRHRESKAGASDATGI